MEKLQPVIAGVKKYNFWIVLSLVCVLLLCFWWMSKPTFSGPFKTNVGTIKTHFTNMGKLGKRGEYPNDDWVKACDEGRAQIDERLNQVARDNYNGQSPARNWGEFGEVRLDRRLSKEDLSKYWQEFLPRQVVDLKQMVNADVDENATGRLIWNRNDFDAIAGRLTPESVHKYRDTLKKLKEEDLPDDEKQEAEEAINKMAWPDTGKVVAAQEIVWVYQTLLSAIGKVNGRPGVDSFNLPIRSIEKIEVWPDADGEPKGTTNLGTRRVRRAGPKKAAAPAQKGIRVPQVQDYYRVVPVRMELQMEHHFLSPLLVALANESLTCEVVDIELTSNPGFTLKKKDEGNAAPPPLRRPFGARPGLGARAANPEAKPEPVQAAVPRGKRTVVEALIYLAKPPKNE